MKILFLTPRYAPHLGGVEKHVEEVTRRLQKRHDICIVTEQSDPSSPFCEKKDDVEIHRIPQQSRISRKIFLWWWFVRHFSLIFSADIIHIHDVFFWVLPFRWLLFWKRFFITFHGYEAPGPPTLRQIFWHQFAELSTEKNICVGDFHQQVYGVTPTFVTYGGLDEDEKKHASKKPNSLVFVGRLAEDTGIYTYCQAASVLPSSYTFDIYGDGPLRPVCEKLVEHAGAKIRFHGFVPDAAKFFPNYESVLSSQYLSMLNGLAAGAHVIAVADSEIKKIYLEETPFVQWIVVAQSPSEMYQEIIQKHETQKHGRDWAAAQTWEKGAETYEQLWRSEADE